MQNHSKLSKTVSPKKLWANPELTLINSAHIASGANHGNYEGAYSNGHGGPAGSPVDATWAFYIHS